MTVSHYKIKYNVYSAIKGKIKRSGFYKSIRNKEIRLILNRKNEQLKKKTVKLALSLLQLINYSKRAILQTDRKINYKKDGILVIKEHNKQQKMQFIRIATINLPEEFPYTPHTNKKRIVYESKVNKLRDSLNNSAITRKKYISKINKIRQTIPIRYPLISHRDLKKYEKNRMGKIDAERISTSLDNLIKQDIEVLYVILTKRKDYIQSLIILIEYGPLYPSHYNKKQVISRPSVLDTHNSLRKYRKLVLLNSEKRIEALKYRSNSHPQSIRIKEEVISTLFHQSSSSHRGIANNYFDETLKTVGKLSSYPDNSILSISHKRFKGRYINIDNFTKIKYLNLMNNRSLYVVANHDDFSKFIQSYRFKSKYKNDIHKVLIFSKIEWPDFQKIELDNLRLALISLKSDNEINSFIFIYMAIDLLYGDRQEIGSSDIMVMIKEILEYDKNLLKSIDTIDNFLKLLVRQLTNQAYLGKTKIISKIYQVFRQFNNRRILNPKKGEFISIEDINQYTHFLTDKSSTESFLSLFIILIKISQERYIKSECPEEITLVIDDPGIIRLLSDRQNYAYFNKCISKLKDLRIIIHSTNPNQYSTFMDIPKLVLNERDYKINRYYSTLHLGTSKKIDVDPIYLKEVSV